MAARSLVVSAVLLAVVASPAFAAKEKFVRAKPHVDVEACLAKLDAVAAAGEADILRVGARWARRIEFNLNAGRYRVALSLLLPAVQAAREAARKAMSQVDGVADGCTRALTRAGKVDDVARIEAARDRLKGELRDLAEQVVDRLWSLFPSDPI